MQRAFDTAEYVAVRNSTFWELRYKQHKNQMVEVTVIKHPSSVSNMTCVVLIPGVNVGPEV